MKKLFTLMGVFALSFSSFAQEIILLEDYLNQPTQGANTTLGNGTVTTPAKARLNALLFHLLPGIAVANDQEHQNFKAGDEVPAVIRIDAAQLGKMATLQANTAAVEAVVIKVRSAADFQQKFPASLLQQLPQLKYVFFDAGTDASPETLQNMLQGEYPGITFLYRVSIPG